MQMQSAWHGVLPFVVLASWRVSVFDVFKSLMCFSH